MAKTKAKKYIFDNKHRPVAASGLSVFEYEDKATQTVYESSYSPSDGNKVVSPPNKPVKWKEAAAWVVKAHAGAWKRLED